MPGKGSGSTVTKEELATIKRLYDSGLGRNAIAKELGRSWQFVGAVCHNNGWAFDRSQTKVAAAASVADSKARLAALAQRSIDAAEKIVTRLEADQYEYTVVVAGKGVVRVKDPSAPAQDLRNLSSAYSSFLVQATRLLDRNDDGGVRAQKSLVEKLSESLGLHDA